MTDAAADVQIWWTTLTDQRWSTAAEHADPLLVGVERERWSAYRQPDDRRRFTAGVVLCRALVARIVGGESSAVRINRDCPTCGAPHGRPVVPGGPQLSVSHSGNVVALAAAGVPVGVDVEDPARAGDMLAVRELLLAAGDAPARDPADLLRLWVRKEAVLKAAGVGLRIPMTSFALAASGSTIDAPDVLTGYSVVGLDIPGAAGALATLGTVPAVRATRWPPAVRPGPGVEPAMVYR